MQLGWRLPLILDARSERALEAFSCFDDVPSNLALNNSVLRRVPHPELASRDLRGSDNFKIREWHKVPDFQLALAHNCQGRRLHATNPDHSPHTSTQDDSCGSGQGQVVNLVGLPTRNGGGVKAAIFDIRSCPAKCVPDGL